MIFGTTNATEVKVQCPPDSTGGVGAKIGYVNHSPEYAELLTVNTGIKYDIHTNYTFKIRAMVKNQNGVTTNDAIATGQISLISGYYDTASGNFVSVKSENVTSLTATGWTEIDFSSNGARIGTSVLGNDMIIRLSRVGTTNTADYLSWVDYIQVDASDPWVDWAAEYGITNATRTGDADGDGIDNFTEFATGGDPTNAALTGLVGPSFIFDAGGGTNRFAYVTPRRADYWAVGVDYYLERNTDLILGSWVGAGTWIDGVGAGGFNADFDAVTNFLGNVADNDTQFLRLRVSHPSYNP